MGHYFSVFKPVQENQKKKKQQQFHHQDWTELPDDILGMIYERLPPSDLIAFSNVCKSWRSIVFDFSFGRRGFPWILMSGQITSKTRTCFSILDKKPWNFKISKANGEYIWGFFQDWLIMVKPVNRLIIQISLVNPFSRKQKISLPNISNVYHKLVLSESPSQDSCIYMLLSRNPFHGFALWISGCDNWCTSKQVVNKSPVDALYYDGFFYLLFSNFDIEVIDAASASCVIKTHGSKAEIKTQSCQLKIPDLVMTMLLDSWWCYLLESCGEILLVCQIGDSKVINGFRVYKLDFRRKTWVKLDNLQNRILFLDGNSCICYTRNELGVEIGNCIFFISSCKSPLFNEWDYTPERPSTSKIDAWGIFYLRDDSLVNFNHPSNSTGSRPLWISAPMWWYYQEHGLVSKVNIMVD